MRIERGHRHPAEKEEYRRRLCEAALAEGVKGRVCSAACAKTCPRCGSTACQCLCAPTCPDAPLALSSEPQRLPLEPAIVPLVFAMKRLALFRPCWSCEGHAHPDGTLARPPRVWFYCDSTVHLRLFANGLSSLRCDHRLSAPWQIAVTFSDPDNVATAFTLEPVPEAKVALAGLQSDVLVIAGELHAMMQREADLLLRALPPP